MSSTTVDVFISPGDKYFYFNLKYLFFLGLWPYCYNLSKKQKILFKIYEFTLHILSITYFVITSIGSYNHRHDIVVLVSNLDKGGIVIIFIMKTICFLYNRQKLKLLIEDIMKSGDKITERCEKLMTKLVCLITGLVTLIVTIFSLNALYEGQMTLEAWMPFDPMKSRMSLFMSAQILAVTFFPVGWRSLGLQGIVCSVIMYFCEQYQELQRRIKALEYKPETETVLREDLKAIIKKHFRLIGYAITLKGILDTFFFFHNLSLTIELCLNAFMVSVVGTGDKKTLVNFLVFLMVALFNTYVYCYLANKMIIESEGISQAAYGATWPSWPVKLQKDLLTVITVSQRPLVLTAGGLSVVSLQTYSQLVYNGYTIYTVMQDMM